MQETSHPKIQIQVDRRRRGSLMQFNLSCFRIVSGHFGEERNLSFFLKPFMNDISHDIPKDSKAF